MTYTNMTNLVSNHGYTATDKFNGKTTKKARQVVKVVAAALVPAGWNGTKQIVAKAIVESVKGVQYDAFVYAVGRVQVV